MCELKSVIIGSKLIWVEYILRVWMCNVYLFSDIAVSSNPNTIRCVCIHRPMSYFRNAIFIHFIFLLTSTLNRFALNKSFGWNSLKHKLNAGNRLKTVIFSFFETIISIQWLEKRIYFSYFDNYIYCMLMLSFL